MHAYEAKPKFGGAAQEYNVPFTLDTFTAKNFFVKRASFGRDSENLFRPARTWHDLCGELLDHKNIQALHSAPIYRLSFFASYYTGDVIFNTVRPDILTNFKHNELPVYGGVPLRTTESTAQYALYEKLVRCYRLVSLGMNALYEYKTVEQCVNEALEIAQAITPENFLADMFLLQDTGEGHDISIKETNLTHATTIHGR